MCLRGRVYPHPFRTTSRTPRQLRPACPSSWALHRSLSKEKGCVCACRWTSRMCACVCLEGVCILILFEPLPGDPVVSPRVPLFFWALQAQETKAMCVCVRARECVRVCVSACVRVYMKAHVSSSPSNPCPGPPSSSPCVPLALGSASPGGRTRSCQPQKQLGVCVKLDNACATRGLTKNGWIL